jgi:hypothetical protein
MLTSSEKRDYILRMIAELRQMLQAVLGKLRDGEPPEGPLSGARATIAGLLGPLAGVAPRMDSVTAGQMVGDADVLGAWAELSAAEARVCAAGGDAGAADGFIRRALELALEAHLRTPADRPELLSLISELRETVDAASLSPRHADALATLAVPSPP